MNEMSADELMKVLKTHLSQQLLGYNELKMMQEKLLQMLKGNLNFTEFMTLLGHKEKKVLLISELSKESQPLISEFLQRKNEMTGSSVYGEIETFLDNITAVVDPIRKMDEEMTTLLNPPRKEDDDPQDLLNAYRALR